LVREEQVVDESGLGHADELARCRARERGVAARGLFACEFGALVRLDVGPEAGAR
jgi:hypothetical protein